MRWAVHRGLSMHGSVKCNLKNCRALEARKPRFWRRHDPPGLRARPVLILVRLCIQLSALHPRASPCSGWSRPSIISSHSIIERPCLWLCSKRTEAFWLLITALCPLRSHLGVCNRGGSRLSKARGSKADLSRSIGHFAVGTSLELRSSPPTLTVLHRWLPSIYDLHTGWGE